MPCSIANSSCTSWISWHVPWISWHFPWIPWHFPWISWHFPWISMAFPTDFPWVFPSPSNSGSSVPGYVGGSVRPSGTSPLMPGGTKFSFCGDFWLFSCWNCSWPKLCNLLLITIFKYIYNITCKSAYVVRNIDCLWWFGCFVFDMFDGIMNMCSVQMHHIIWL